MNFVNLNAAAAVPADFAKVAELLGCEVAAVRAVWQVESRSRSYDNKGRLVMLFEPHVFYRLLGAGQKRDAAVQAGIAYPKWRKGYPDDSYPRLLTAIDIGGEEIACRSASWGGPQIMGFNYKLCGYVSAVAMHQAFLTGEGPQIEAFGKFVQAAGLSDELRQRDWAGFAFGYNGEGYKENEYDTRLSKAFRYWKDRPDAVPPPEPDDGPLPATQRAETAPGRVLQEQGDQPAPESVAEPDMIALVQDWLAKEAVAQQAAADAKAALDLVKMEAAK